MKNGKLDAVERRALLGLLLEQEDKLTSEQKIKLAELMKFVNDDFLYNKLKYWSAYPKQWQFFAAGAKYRERCLMAPNRVGKSDTGAAETAYHLTGLYPEGWNGRRWKRATRGWAAGLTSLVTRDIMQKKLCGTPGVDDGPTGFGTGLIPKHLFVGRPSTQRGIADAFDMIQVRHVSGGISTLNFKSFEQGRAKFQGDALDFGWADEEGEIDVYMEFLFRMAAHPTNPEGGILFTTYTPILGKTQLTHRFMEEHTPERIHIHMGLRDALHISKEEAAILERNCPAHEREARIYGRPGLGGGAVFPFSEELYTEPAIVHIPLHWRKIWGLDFGIDHPFGCALLLYDPDNDVLHVHHSYQMKDLQGAIIKQHVAPILRLGVQVPVAWPHDGAKRDPKSGEPMATQYKAEGVRMLSEHATFATGGYSLEASVMEMHERLGSGRMKIASHLSTLLGEIRGYRRAEGKIVAINDDEISAVRYAMMMKRFSAAVTLGPKKAQQRSGPGAGMADGVDFDPFTGR